MKKYLFILCCIGLWSGCGAPKHLLRPRQLKDHTKGLLIEITIKKQSEKMKGELIAISPDHLTFLLLKTKSVTNIPQKNIENLEVVVSLSSNSPNVISLVAIILNLTPLSHGIYMSISIPVNLIGGSMVANNASKASYRIKYPEQVSWEELAKFARFPQGIPKGIDPLTIM